MYSTIKTIKTISLIGAFVLAAATSRAVDPPPDGGYPNANTAEGEDALFNLTTGFNNTAIGFKALYSNTTGYYNTADGYQALYSNLDGHENTASGQSAMYSNTTGIENAAFGYEAMYSNKTGESNTAFGAFALHSNSTGIVNTANGGGALLNNSTGYGNTASGTISLWSNNIGYFNTATGYQALYNNTTGHDNLALGNKAGLNLTTGNFNIDIANAGVAGESGAIRIGTAGDQTATFIAGIRGTPLASGVGVGVSADGQLGVRPSSVRFKEGIKPMDKVSEAILALKPVTFHYKKALDPKGRPQFGLVAEEVAKVDPDLVVSDEKGKPFTVRYEEVNAMLLNEFLKEHKRGQQQDATISELKSVVAKQQEQITALASQMMTVSNRVELIKGAPPVVASEP